MKKVFVLSVQLLLAFAPAAAQEANRAETCEGPVYKSTEVSRKAVIYAKPDPGFTEEARKNDVRGVVRLRGVLCRTGRVTDIRVVRGLPDGLTELAISAASRVKFKPAEKDGRPVSTYLTFEYNFNDFGGDECKSGGCAGRLVEELVIEGNRRLTDEEILRHVKTRPGVAYDAGQVERDLQTLLGLSAFDTTTRVTTERGARGGVVVIFFVRERLVVRDLTFTGLEGVTEADVLKAWGAEGVRLCKECSYDPSHIAAAREVLRKLLAARGQPGATVEVRVEELSSVSVALSFVIDKAR